MKKISILIAFILFVAVSFGQGVPIVNNTTISNAATQYHVLGLLTGDVAVKIPTLDTLLHPAVSFAGSIIRFTDGFAYMSNGVFWERIGFTSGDTLLAELPLYIDINLAGQRVLKILHPDGIVTPGYVSWSGSGLTFDVTSSLYYLNYQQYISPSSQITLAVADPTNSRIDKIGVDTNSAVIAVTGTAAVTPIAPQLNPSSQLSLTDIYLLANDTIPSGITVKVIYDENIEWVTDTTGDITVDYDNTDNPYHLTKAAFVQTYTDQSTLTFTDTGIDTAQVNELLKMFIYSNGAFANNIYFQLFNGSTPITNNLALNAQFGFNPLDSNVYQNVTIPFTAFTFSGNIFNKLVITMGGEDISGAKGLYFDYIQLQTGINNTPVGTNNKVDSVTMVGDLEYYWINGFSYFITDLSLIADTVYTRIPIAVDTTTIPGKQILYLLHLNGLESGNVTIDSCLTIDVTPAIYYINYNQYNSAATFGLPIATPDGTFPRIDIVVADTNLVISVITGTPSATPVAPPYNSFSQVLLAEILVGAGVTCLGTQEIIYDGIIDDPAQWDTATSGTLSVNFSNTANPYHLNQAAYTVTYTDSSQLIFTKPSGTDTVKATSVLKGFITVVGAFTNQMSAQWYNGSVAVSNQLLLNPYFNVNDSNQYQIFAPPLNAWSWPGGTIFNKLIITFGGNDVSGAKGLYLDWIQLQTGITNVATTLQLTTIGTSGASTYDNITKILNIPIYSGQGGSGTVLDTTFEWSVRDSLSTPAVLPPEGSIFLVGTSPTGAFVGHANNIATIDSVANTYSFDTASIGDLLYNATTGFVSQLIGSTWVRLGRPVIHQGGDTYATNIVIGSNDNNAVTFKANNLELGRFEPSTTRFKLGRAINSLSSFTYADSNHIGFFRPTLYDFYNTATSAGVDFYTGGVLGIRQAGAAFSATTGNLTTIRSGNWLSNYEALTLQGGNFAGTGTVDSSIILKAEFTNNTTRAIVYDNGNGGTNSLLGPPISLLPIDGNLIVGGRNTSDVNNAVLNVVTNGSINKGSIVAPKYNTANMLAVTSGISAATRVAGSGYTNGTYNANALTGGTGTGATANLVVSTGGVSSATIVAQGINYAVGDVLSSATIGAGTGFTFTVSAVTNTSALIVYNTDSLCYCVWNGTAWRSMCGSGGGGGSETMQQTFDNSVTTLDNPIIDLGGSVFNVQQGGETFLEINPGAFSSTLGATDGTAFTQVINKAELGDGSVFFRLFSDDGTNPLVEIKGDAIAQTITHTADTHIFNANGNQAIYLDGSNFGSRITADDGTSHSGLDLHAYTTDPSVDFDLSSTDGVNTVRILGEPIANTITHTADTILLNSTLSGKTTGNVWTLKDAATGSGYWGAGTLANNGLTKVVDSIKLGGVLTEMTTISGNLFPFKVLGSVVSAGAQMEIANSGTGGGLNINTQSGIGLEIFANTSGIGAVISSQTGAAMVLGSGTALPLEVYGNPSTTNSVTPIIYTERYSTGTPANGIGQSMVYFVETTSGLQESNTIVSKWTDATNATRTSEFSITGVNSAVTNTLFTIAGDGRVYGTGLHNSAGAVTGTTNQYLASGTFTPTLTNVTNIAASTAYDCQWIRVGNVVTVSGKVDIDVTLGVASELGMSLPIASAFTADENLGGTASSSAAASLVSAIRADATNDRAALVFTAVSLTNDSYFFEFTYLIK